MTHWTPQDDLDAASEEAAKLRVFDAAHKADEPHWADDEHGGYWLSERVERIVICCAIAALVIGSGICAAVAL